MDIPEVWYDIDANITATATLYNVTHEEVEWYFNRLQDSVTND